MPRFISMANFRNPTAAAVCATRQKGEQGFPLGQVIGHVTSVEEKHGVATDGTPTVSWAAYGEFEAVVYAVPDRHDPATGEVVKGSGKPEQAISSGAIYLPKYYAQEMQRALGTGATMDGQLLFGVEISMVPTGNTALPYAYEVTNITNVTRSQPLQRLKSYMHKIGRLRIPYDPAAPGPGLDVEALPHLAAPAGSPPPVSMVEGEQPPAPDDTSHPDAGQGESQGEQPAETTGGRGGRRKAA